MEFYGSKIPIVFLNSSIIGLKEKGTCAIPDMFHSVIAYMAGLPTKRTVFNFNPIIELIKMIYHHN